LSREHETPICGGGRGGIVEVYKRLTARIETFWPHHSREHPLAFTRKEWRRLAGLYGVVAFLHVCGWGLFLYFSSRYQALVGLGFVAYM
jgi:hypothetical protein